MYNIYYILTQVLDAVTHVELKKPGRVIVPGSQDHNNRHSFETASSITPPDLKSIRLDYVYLPLCQRPSLPGLQRPRPVFLTGTIPEAYEIEEVYFNTNSATPTKDEINVPIALSAFRDKGRQISLHS